MTKLDKAIEALQKGEVFEGKVSGYDGNKYRVIIHPKTENSMPFILLIPKKPMSMQIVMETNNCEQDSLSQEYVQQASSTADKLLCITKQNPCPIFVPLVPNVQGGVPYFQQLSKECLTLGENSPNYRIDDQVVASLSVAKDLIEKETGKKPEEKVFLNGYSASGCFAQRFCLLHPEVVKTCVLGGCSGSIPVLSKDLDYPIGIKDYEKLTGKIFLIDEYQKIDFHYYVGEFETQNKSSTRVDDFGRPAPMHDMSYMDRSIPTEVGQKQREMFGNDLFERADKSVEELHKHGIKVEHTVLPGLTHQGIGNEVVAQSEKVFNAQFKRERSF